MHLQIVHRIFDDNDTRRVNLAAALYEATKESDDPPFARLQAWEQHAWLEDARQAERRCDPIARQVAVEMAAQAYAELRGWTWPELDGCLPTNPGASVELFRIETRAHIRQLAKVVTAAYDKHLRAGGIDRHPEIEDRCVLDLKLQREMDASRRELLKPPPGGSHE